MKPNDETNNADWLIPIDGRTVGRGKIVLNSYQLHSVQNFGNFLGRNGE